MSRARQAAVVVATVAVASLTASFLIPAAAFAVDYPSAAEVQAAMKSVAAKKAEIAKIQGILSGIEAQQTAASSDAQLKAENYNIAEAALASATQSANELQSQADAAKKVADAAGRRAGQLVSQLSRVGGGDVTIGLMFDTGSPSELLYQLGTVSQLTERSRALVQQYTFAKNSAQALGDEAKQAARQRAQLADAAKAAYSSAQQSADALETQVNQTKSASDTMYSQLATLENTTATLEQQRQAGLAWEAAQNAVKTAPRAPVLNPNPPAPNPAAVAGAIAFAEAQLGKPYVLGGAGPNVWDCSGITMMAYASVGVYIGIHSATNQYNTMANEGRLVTIQQLQAGDLLFYSTGGSITGVKYHTTLYIGNGEMIEAPYPGSVVRIRPIRYGDLVPYAGRPTP